MLAVEAFGLGFLYWEPHLNCSAMLRLLTSLTGLVDASTETISTLMLTCRQTLLTIVALNTPLFVSNLLLEILHSKQVSDRMSNLKLLGLVIVKVFVI